MVAVLACTLALTLLALPAHARTVTWTMPRYSAYRCTTEIAGIPAGTKKLRLYVWNQRDRVWRILYGFNYRVAGSQDGKLMRLSVPTWRCARGDSCGAMPAIYDSVGNFPCYDPRVHWRQE